MAIITNKPRNGKKKRTSTIKTNEHEKKGNAKEIAIRLAGNLAESQLNDNQTRFAQIYASHPLYRGNGAMSYALAYGWINDGDTEILGGKPAIDTCKSNGHKLVKNDRIAKAINAILDTLDLNDQAVDAQLAHLIHQHDDKSSKLGAIKEYYRITNRGGQNADGAQTIIQNLYMQIVQGNAPQMPNLQ